MEFSIKTLEDLSLHSTLKDIEDIFSFWLLSHKILGHPDVEKVIVEQESPFFVELFKKYRQRINLQTNWIDSHNFSTSGNIKDNSVFMGKTLAILMFDLLSVTTYNTSINRIREFQFLRYIRNGAAHYNKFNLKYTEDGENKKEKWKKGDWKIKEKESIEWRGKYITQELHDKKVFNDFINIGDVFMIAKDLSEKLFELDYHKD